MSLEGQIPDTPAPTPDYGRVPLYGYGAAYTGTPIRPPKPRYWIPVAITCAVLFVLLIVFAIAAVVRSVYVGGKIADQQIVELHNEMEREDWDGIYGSADPKYRDATTQEASKALFMGIARKLGTPVSSKQSNTQVQATTSGKYLISNFETIFSQNAKATETVIWRQSAGRTYRLVGYNIRSDALITR